MRGIYFDDEQFQKTPFIYQYLKVGRLRTAQCKSLVSDVLSTYNCCLRRSC